VSDLIAHASITINAPIDEVWDALVNPTAIREYMFGTDAISGWHEGSSITWKGTWQGATYEDRGVILRLQPGRLLEYTHFSPLLGLPDRPENYHTVTIELRGEGSHTLVSLAQDNNPTREARAHSEENWGMMLAGLKTFVET
jgi:uncharacterized protein YndB with AHSA1/START domain